MENKRKTSKKKKASSNIKSKRKMLVVILCVFVLAFAFLVASSFLIDSSSDDSSSETTNTQTAYYEKNVSKSKFPIEFSDGINAVKSSKNSIFVLSKRTVYVFSSSGTQTHEEAFSFADAEIKVSGKYALVYDRQGVSYILMNGKKTLTKDKSYNEGKIITAAVSSDGKYLIASRSDDATSMLTYYSKSGKILFQWLCANEHIVSCSVSSDSKKISCAAISSENGEIYTKVYYFNIKDSSKNLEYKAEDSCAMDCFFASSNRIILNCTNKRISLKVSREELLPSLSSFSSSLIMRSNSSTGYTATISPLDSSFDSVSLTLYNPSNEVVYTTSVTDDVKDIVCIGKKVYLLADSEIITVNSSAKMTSESTSKNSENFCVLNNRFYHYTTDALYYK